MQYCQSLDMRLISIESQEEQDNLQQQLMEKGKLLKNLRIIKIYD